MVSIYNQYGTDSLPLKNIHFLLRTMVLTEQTQFSRKIGAQTP